jgi:hypothetical protein
MIDSEGDVFVKYRWDELRSELMSLVGSRFALSPFDILPPHLNTMKASTFTSSQT